MPRRGGRTGARRRAPQHRAGLACPWFPVERADWGAARRVFRELAARGPLHHWQVKTTAAPVGFDLGQLLAGLAQTGELDPTELPAIHAAIIPAYLEGLRNEGVDADLADVRTGYVGSLLLRSGFTGPPLELLGRSDEPGIADLFAQRARYTRFLLDLRREVHLST